MYRSMLKSIFPVSLMALLAACAPQGGHAIKAQVIKVGQTKLVLKDKDSVMFLPISESDRENLKGLRKDEEVTLIGHHPEGESEKTVDIDEIVTESGRHIPLGA